MNMPRERITITVEAELLPAIDQLIDGSSIRNRSHAIEHAIRQGLLLHSIAAVFFIQGKKNIPLPQWEALLAQTNTLAADQHFLVAPAAQTTEFTQLTALLPVPLTLLPADFGSAAALLLQETPGSLLIIDLDGVQTLPNLLPAFTFHKQQGATVTHLVAVNGASLTPAGAWFAEPDLRAQIPAGKADLLLDVFPHLVKLAKVSTYAY